MLSRICPECSGIEDHEAGCPEGPPPLAPEEFFDSAASICEQHRGAPEQQHSELDALMEDTLKDLGYGKGIEVIRKADRWYA